MSKRKLTIGDFFPKMIKKQVDKTATENENVENFQTHCEFGKDISICYNPPGDGNCQFAAASYFLCKELNHNVSADDLRKQVVDYLASSPHLLDGTILSVQDYVDNNDVASYLKHMIQSGTYGDHLTLTAITCLYKVIFIIVSTLGTEGTRIISPLKDSVFSNEYKVFLLGHFAENQGCHYVCLKSSSQDAITQILSLATNSRDENCNSDKVKEVNDDKLAEVRTSTCAAFQQQESLQQSMLEPNAMDISSSIVQGPVQPRLSTFKVTAVNGKKRCFSNFWYDKYPYIEYSQSSDSVFCFPCRHFAIKDGYSDPLFSVKGCRDWKHIGDRLDCHNNSSSHKNAIAMWHSWQQSQKVGSVTSQISCQLKKEIEENRSRLCTLGRVALLCARQDLALRGHRETQTEPDGQSNMACDHNMGNFLEIVNLLKLESTSVRDKLNNMPQKACYTSKDSQNELLSSAAICVREIITKEVTSGEGWYSVIADEARDNRSTEQMSVCIRYVYGKEIKERFLGFVDLHALDADSLANTIATVLIANRLPLEKCISQSYDGASVMSGCCSGVQALFRKKTGNACPYIHCNAHRLNLVLVDVSHTVDLVANTIGLLEAIYSFQSASTLRHDKFVEAQTEAGFKVLEIPQQSDTRWVCKFRGVSFFLNRFCCVKNALQNITNNKNKKDAAEAKGLLMQLSDFKVIFALTFLEELLSTTNGLSEQLQSSTQDFGTCLRLVRSIINVMKSRRSDTHFDILWLKAVTMADEVNVSVLGHIETRKRTSASSKLLNDSVVMSSIGSRSDPVINLDDKKQVLRSQYFQVLDHVIAEMERRFSDNADVLTAADACSPPSRCFLSCEILTDFAEKHSFLNIDQTQLFHQCEVARTMFVSKEPTEQMETVQGLHQLYLKLMDMKLAFPDIIKIVKLLLTIPVATASAERSFSTMRRIKNYLRSSMNVQRLSNLAILSIERELSGRLMKNPDDLVTEFANMTKRRLSLILH